MRQKKSRHLAFQPTGLTRKTPNSPGQQGRKAEIRRAFLVTSGKVEQVMHKKGTGKRPDKLTKEIRRASQDKTTLVPPHLRGEKGRVEEIRQAMVNK